MLSLLKRIFGAAEPEATATAATAPYKVETPAPNSTAKPKAAKKPTVKAKTARKPRTPKA